MHSVCEGIVVVDTFVALSNRVNVELDGAWYHGHVYGEHDADRDRGRRRRRLWASLDNESELLVHGAVAPQPVRAGRLHVVPSRSWRRRCRATCATGKTYVAVKGRPAGVLTSDETDRQPDVDVPEGAESADGAVPGSPRRGVRDGETGAAARGQGRHQADPCARSSCCRQTRRRSSSATSAASKEAARGPTGTSRAPRARSGSARRRPRTSRCAG